MPILGTWEIYQVYYCSHSSIAGSLVLSWGALDIPMFLHWLFGSIGVCLGYHRPFSHRSFKVPRWLEYAIAR